MSLRILAASGAKAGTEPNTWQTKANVRLIDTDLAANTMTTVTEMQPSFRSMWVESDRRGGYYTTEHSPPGVVQFKLDGSEMGTVPTGAGPCHIAVSPNGETIAVSEYETGVVSIYSPGSATPSQVVKTSTPARTPKEGRQDAPHPHSATFLDDNAFVVCDLGSDSVQMWQKEEEWVSSGLVEVEGFAGVRHSAFSADGKTLYAVGELSNELIVIDVVRDAKIGLKFAERRPLLCAEWLATNPTAPFPAYYTAPSHASGIKVLNNLVFVANRGHDTIAVYHTDSATGLTKGDAMFFPSGGRVPWEFDVKEETEGGNYLVAVTNQFGETVDHDGCIVLYRFSVKDGAKEVARQTFAEALFCKIL